MTFLGIDLGTSFIKGAVLDLEDLRLKYIQRVPFPAPISGLPPLFREFDPAQILGAVRSLLDRLLPYAEGCEGLVMCGQMHSLIFTTGWGEPRSNLITWQDQRLLLPHPSGEGTYYDVLKRRISPEEIRQLGNELRPGLPIAQLFWFAEHGQLPTTGVIPASLLDFVMSNLCSSPPTTDITNAHAHGALNLETLDWHHTVLSRLGLARLPWPEIKQHSQVTGWLSAGSRRLPCYPPIGDYQCALAGALLEFGELSLNISTGSQVSLLRPQAEYGNFQTRIYFEGRFLSTITHIPAGRSLNMLVKLLSELAIAQKIELLDPWPYITSRAAQVEVADLRVNLAFFNSPCGDHGEIANIREPELTVGHLFRAAFQNMADNYHTCALRLSPEKAWRNLVFSGGLAQKIDVLREIISGKFQLDYRLCPTEEDTLLGLLSVALVISGRLPTIDQATAVLAHKYKEF